MKYALFALALVFALGLPAHAAAPQSIQIVGASANEASGAMPMMVKRVGPIRDVAVSFTLQTISGTAQPGMDYVAINQPFTLQRGEMSKTISDPLVNDTLYRGNRSFTGKITAGVNARLYVGSATFSIVDDDAASVPTPAPTPTATLPLSEKIKLAAAPGLADVASNFVTATEVVPASLPGPDGDVVGAFRFQCTAGQILYDDPVVYPKQKGKSHLHQFYGNTKADADSTYESLRTSGESTCLSPLNRSAYWMPAMLDGHGYVVRPDLVTVYYKRRPLSDPKCSLTSGDPQPEGNCAPLVNGLRFVQGYNMTTHVAPPAWTGSGAGMATWTCTNPTTGFEYAVGSTLADIAARCPTGKNADGRSNKVHFQIKGVDCWDGKNLDSADHRSHVANTTYAEAPYPKCPSTHPYRIPTFTLAADYTVDANLADWRLSTDDMEGKPAGTTLHFDWFGAWDNPTMAAWMDNCINKLISCSSGNLGNGTALKNTAGVDSTGPTANPRLVPQPINPITGTTMQPM